MRGDDIEPLGEISAGKLDTPMKIFVAVATVMGVCLVLAHYTYIALPAVTQLMPAVR